MEHLLSFFRTLQLYCFLTLAKNGSNRFIGLVPELENIIKQVINEQDDRNEWLFPCKNTHIQTVAIKSIFRRIKNALDIEILSAHKLRHLYATSLLKQGVDLKTISKLLGHKSIRMTMRYLDVTEREIFEKSKEFNPLYLASCKKE